MTKNKWTVRLILLVTIILAGLIILFNIKVKENNIHISKLGLANNILESGNLDFDCANGFWIDDVQQNHGDKPPFTIPYINGSEIYCIEQGKDEGYDYITIYVPVEDEKFIDYLKTNYDITSEKVKQSEYEYYHVKLLLK